jgi:hypothetical protein
MTDPVHEATAAKTERQRMPFGRGQLRKAVVAHLENVYPAPQSLGAVMIAIDGAQNSVCKVCQELVREGAAEQDRFGRYRLKDPPPRT